MEYKLSERGREQFDLILDGIDQDQMESDDGWWETMVGAEFGENKKKELMKYIERLIGEAIEEALEKRTSARRTVYEQVALSTQHATECTCDRCTTLRAKILIEAGI